MHPIIPGIFIPIGKAFKELVGDIQTDRKTETDFDTDRRRNGNRSGETQSNHVESDPEKNMFRRLLPDSMFGKTGQRDGTTLQRSMLLKEMKMYDSTSFSGACIGQETITGQLKKIQETDVDVTQRRVSEAEEVFETRKISVKSGLSSMFGGYLNDAVDEETGVSQFVVWCVDAVETTGRNFKTDALYRASGNQAKVQEIATTAAINMQEKLKKEVNVNVLTGALKLFFRQLKEPLLDYDEFQYVSQRPKDDLENACRETKKIIESLGDVEQKTLKYIMKHLIEVLKHTASNNMSVEGMGVVFGPTLMRLSYDTVNMAGDMRQQNRVVEFFLNNYDNIFTS